MATLLMDEYPLMVSPWLAKEIGLNEAIFLQQLRFWESKNMGRVDEDGRRWIYNSIPAWLQQFPFLSERTLKRVLTSLESKGLLLTTTRFNRPADRTKSYAINEDMLLVYDERYMAERQLCRKKVAAEKNAVHDFLSEESSSERKSQSVPTIVPNWHDAENQGSEEFIKEKSQSVLTNVPKWRDGKCHFGTLDEEAVSPDAARLQGISSRVRVTQTTTQTNLKTTETKQTEEAIAGEWEAEGGTSSAVASKRTTEAESVSQDAVVSEDFCVSVLAQCDELGIEHASAQKFVRVYGSEVVRQKLKLLRKARRTQRIQNPSGWLCTALAQDFSPPQREIEEELRRKNRQRRNAERRQERARWNDENDERTEPAKSIDEMIAETTGDDPDSVRWRAMLIRSKETQERLRQEKASAQGDNRASPGGG